MSTQKSKAVPAYLKKYQEQAAGQADKLAEASTSVPRLSLKGKKFKIVGRWRGVAETLSGIGCNYSGFTT